MRIGELFTRTDVVTEPCPGCGAPSVKLDDGSVHFEKLPNGAKTTYTPCRREDLTAHNVPTLF